MSAPVTYRYSDAGAPLVTGQAGTWKNAMKAILGAGYGSMPGQGWTVAFESGNKIVLRQAGGAQRFLRIDDSLNSGRTGGVNFYDTMSDVDTGTARAPDESAGASGLSRYGHANNNTGDARQWVCYADDRTVFFFILATVGGSHYAPFYFGDFISNVPGDAYKTAMCCDENWQLFTTYAAATAKVTLARNYLGAAGAVNYGWVGDRWLGAGTAFRGVIPYPDPLGTGKVHVSPVYIAEPGQNAPRGIMRGLWHFLHNTVAIADRDTFLGTEDETGREFQLVRNITLNGAATETGTACIETTEWDT